MPCIGLFVYYGTNCDVISYKSLQNITGDSSKGVWSVQCINSTVQHSYSTVEELRVFRCL